jgi:hypothetical protein
MAVNIRIALACAVALTVTAGTASAQIKGDAIRIGVLTDMNGVFATAMGPGSVEAACMAAEEFGGAIEIYRPITRTSLTSRPRWRGAGSSAKMSRRSPTAAARARHWQSRNWFAAMAVCS